VYFILVIQYIGCNRFTKIADLQLNAIKHLKFEFYFYRYGKIVMQG